MKSKVNRKKSGQKYAREEGKKEMCIMMLEMSLSKEIVAQAAGLTVADLEIMLQ